MEETANAAAPRAEQQNEALARENAALKEGVAALQALLLATANEAAAERKQLEQLREANQELVLATFGAQDSKTAAEEKSRRQNVFLSMLAHELRNPLAPIAMVANVLESLDIAHPMLPSLNAIMRRQLTHMMRLVDDLLDASRISSGKISLRKSMVALDDVIGSALETAQPPCNARGQRVEVNLPGAPIVICGDAIRLSQLFSNLLINASKFTPANETIRVSAQVQESAVTVSVKDNGVGIPAGLQPYIFDLFTQGAQTLEASHGGLGIGLSLVRTIAEMHGGTVKVVSAGAGCGSEFLVRLPLPHDAPAAPDAPQSP